MLFVVWNNLFSDAFKFTPHGGKGSLTLEVTEQQVIVKIADTRIVSTLFFLKRCDSVELIGNRMFIVWVNGIM